MLDELRMLEESRVSLPVQLILRVRMVMMPMLMLMQRDGRDEDVCGVGDAVEMGCLGRLGRDGDGSTARRLVDICNEMGEWT